jgi:cytochrome c
MKTGGAMKRFLNASLVVLLFFFLGGTGVCGPQDSASTPDKGIGPIKAMKLGPLDQKLVNEGKPTFGTVCVSCHTLDKRSVGPPLGKVAKERTPEYIMNLLLNTAEMAQKDPNIKRLIVEYGVTMPQPNINEKQARAILEYLRSL